MNKALSFLLLIFLCTSNELRVQASSTTAGPARTSCNAAYSTPCSRVNSEWLARDTAIRLAEALDQKQDTADDVFQDVTLQKYNMERGFYPFVFERSTSTCVAHGADPSLVGETLEDIFKVMGIGFSSATALQSRFGQAASRGGDWVQYMWRDQQGTRIINKVAFVTNVTADYYIGVGYSQEQLPPDLPCSDKFDSWCSINNVRSLVGKAQLRLNGAETLEQFEAALYDISFDKEEYQIEGGHYLFMYNYKGPLKAHAHLHRFTGHDLTYIFENLNRDPEEGAALHQVLMAAAEGKDDGWAQYKWKNTVDEPEYIKIAYNVKIEFMGEEYFLGCGYNFIMGDVVAASRSDTESSCSPSYNLPCAFGSTLQLSSHALSHAVSSPLAVSDMLDAVTNDPILKSGDYYVFMFDFNGTCVAHGARPDLIGMTDAQIFGQGQVSTSNQQTSSHEQFRLAAEQGGGYVLNEWTLPGEDDSNVQKISYIFKFTLEGRDYYGGVGFDNQRAPVQSNLETGTKKNGESIACSREYGSECSEVNAQAIPGQALADLVIASTETKVRPDGIGYSMQDILSNITAGKDLYRVNDFFVSVFSVEQSLCSSEEGSGTGIIRQDNSGCCIAHGDNSDFVGKSWQDILDAQKITSIRGVDLHSRLVGQTDRGGDWTEYSWAQGDGGAQTKLAFSSRFKHDGQNYYIVAEYLKGPPPPTCRSCPDDMECVSADQAFCEPKIHEEKFIETIGFVALLSMVLGVPTMGILFCWIGKRREKRQAQAQIQEIDEKMQTMSKQIEREKKTASKTQKLVSSLFPKNVQDRILEELDEEQSGEEDEIQKNSTDRLASFLKSEDPARTSSTASRTAKSRPIADLFPEATILFMDIVGFTAWSSTREPSQVFSLLETLYQNFDRIASSLDVFKVETVGDCYVAVAGLPEARPDHAIMMARFAHECLGMFRVLVKQLEVELGPDTGELRLRIGLHSGPVTAGVLRGDRGRFQLFGDTVNTTSRMESNGKPNKIHLSQETADLLVDAGKAHWIKTREDKIVVKGKGEMNTYWLESAGSEPGDAKETDIARRSGLMSLPKSVPNESFDSKRLDNKHHRLVDWNVDMLKKVLIEVIANRKACGVVPDSQEHLRLLEQDSQYERTTLAEVQEIVDLPSFDPDAAKIMVHSELDRKLEDQLQVYVAALASMYRDNAFHSFERLTFPLLAQHASHVTMSVVKLLSRIVAPEASESNSSNDHRQGIKSPLTQFTVLLSALIHDVDHPGVPNTQLIKEKTSLAAAYENKSVAELNSLDLAWSLLMQDEFVELRKSIYATEAEFKRFRSLMVNVVLATDIQDKELKSLRNARWERAFSEQSSEESITVARDRKATIVIEHLIQASDVAHTMQHWHIYQKWNERFFVECYQAYREGRAEKDPSEAWYKGEIGFFDFYIIPLAKKLKDCGVFGVSSDEYLNYAQTNRREWERKGREVVAGLVEKARNKA
eukprot:scaffold2872_cov193-Amphora_coffeaeformis.AAC.1